MKAKIALLAAAALALTPTAALALGEVPGTPECDAAATAYANTRSPWMYSSQWFYWYTWYENEGCTGVE